MEWCSLLYNHSYHSQGEPQQEEPLQHRKEVSEEVLARNDWNGAFQEILREKPSPEKYLKLSRLGHDVSAPSSPLFFSCFR